METLEEFHKGLHCGQISFDSLAETCWEQKAEIERLRKQLRIARGDLTDAERHRQDFLDGTLDARQDNV